MDMNLTEAVKQFITMARQQHGSNFDPAPIAQNMTGGKYSTPKEALDAFLKEGRINQQQYDKFLKIL